jgi:two-component system, chemotaxis family, response regulator Rcp1
LFSPKTIRDVILVRMARKDAGLNCKSRVLAEGEEALAFIGRLDQDFSQPVIDLPLMDLNSPKPDGEEILMRLRSTERIAQTPVIVVTGSYAPRAYESAQKNAALHYFRKPVNFAEYMLVGMIIRDLLDLLLSRKSVRSEISDFRLKEGAGL